MLFVPALQVRVAGRQRGQKHIHRRSLVEPPQELCVRLLREDAGHPRLHDQPRADREHAEPLRVLLLFRGHPERPGRAGLFSRMDGLLLERLPALPRGDDAERRGVHHKERLADRAHERLVRDARPDAPLHPGTHPLRRGERFGFDGRGAGRYESDLALNRLHDDVLRERLRAGGEDHHGQPSERVVREVSSPGVQPLLLRELRAGRGEEDRGRGHTPRLDRRHRRGLHIRERHVDARELLGCRDVVLDVGLLDVRKGHGGVRHNGQGSARQGSLRGEHPPYRRGVRGDRGSLLR